MRNFIKFFALITVFAAISFAQTRHSFPITSFPTWVVGQESSLTDTIFVELEFPDLERRLTDPVILFSRNPGGARVEHYTESVVNGVDRELFLDQDRWMRKITFTLQENPNFRAGINYVIIHDRTTGENSNEVKIIVSHTEQNRDLRIDGRLSGAVVPNTTPRLSWTKPAGVPFSHVVLSDEEIKIGTDADGNLSIEDISGISMIWQAITRDNSIVYGEPDPSGIFASAPPPLSPGKRYSWLVFNNYGNNPAYTTVGFTIPAFFGITPPIGPNGLPIMRPDPKGVFPVSIDEENPLVLDYRADSVITFQWTNLDPRAIVYKVFLYTAADMGDIEAQVLVWSGEVMAGAGRFTAQDTASLEMTAANILSANKYTWRVVAMYPDGTGQTGELNTFRYSAPSGQIVVRTFEEIPFGSQRFVQNLALAEIGLEVLQGSLEETVLFFTDGNGWAERVRSVGTMRITAQKDGYESASQIIELNPGGNWKWSEDHGDWINGWGAKPREVNLYLRRPFSSIFGNISGFETRNVNNRDSVINLGPVNLANIIAVSDNGDTVRTQSLPDGNFVLNCGSGDWTVSVSRQGFINPAQRRINLQNAQNRNEDFRIERINHTLSGVVRNTDGQAITGATVRVFNGDRSVEIAALLSTPSDGRFSFALVPGRYILVASKTGLVPEEIPLEFTSSQNRQIVLASNAAMLSGTLYGLSYIGTTTAKAALTNARVEVIDTTGGSDTTVIATGTTDRVYGTYSISVQAPETPNTQYLMRFSAEGFNDVEGYTDALNGIQAGFTHLQNFEMIAFASISGRVIPGASLSAQGVSVSLRGTRANNNNEPHSVITTTDNNGNFSFFRVPDGTYTISASGQRQTTDFTTANGDVIADNIIEIKGGRFLVNSAPISDITINTKEANATIVWTANQHTGDNSTISFTVFSPLVRTLERDTNNNVPVPNSGVLHYAAAGVNYILRATSSDTNIISLVEASFVITEEEGQSGKVSRNVRMPFRRVPPTGATEQQKATLDVSNLLGVNVLSARVSYRVRGETQFIDSVIPETNITPDNISVEIDLGARAGNNLEYFFVIETSEGRYSNETFLFTRFVAANPRIITRMEFLPNTGDNTLVLPLNGRLEVGVRAFYGANFIPIENLSAADIEFHVSTNAISITQTGGASAIITAQRAGDAVLTVRLRQPGSYELAENAGIDPINVQVLNSNVATISAFLLSTPENPGFILNNERVIFGVDVRDNDGNRVDITPNWIVRPREAGDIIAASGEFIPRRSFVGRAYITAEINSRIRHEFSLGNERGALIGHTAMSSPITTSANNAKDDGRAELVFPSDTERTPVTLLLDIPEIRNSIMRSVETLDNTTTRKHLISDIVEIHRHVGENLADSSVILRLFVPRMYHDNLRNGDNLTIAIWDEENIRWDYPRNYFSSDDRDNGVDTNAIHKNFRKDNISYCHETKSITFPIGGLIDELNTFRAAIMIKGLASGVEVAVRPNPFSPFVSPKTDPYLHHLNINDDIRGTCIIITPRGSSNNHYSPSAQVNIFNAEGTMVYNVRLDGLIPGQSYYLFWDGRIQLSRAPDLSEVQPDRPLWIRGNEGSPLARNGRYFVNITIDDGKKLHRQTREIILFK